jgi:hypothetical protein
MAAFRPFFLGLLLTALAVTASHADFGDTLFVAVGEQSDDAFGWPLDCAGDIDGDGFNDLVVADYLNSAGGNNAGRAYVYFTGPSMDSSPDIIVTGTAADQLLGTDVGSAGDFNGDGRDDLAIGANGSGNGRGRLFLFWGDSTLVGNVSAGDADLKIAGEALYTNRFGDIVEPMDDLNGDGLTELLTTALGYEASSRAYVFFGDSTLSGVVQAADADIIVTGIQSISAASSGDFNGDLVPDIVLGDADQGTGTVYLFLGDPAFTGELTPADADLVLTGGPGTNGDFGAGLTLRGDLNGDGFDDLVVGAPFWDSVGPDLGATFAFYGRAVVPGSMIAADADLTIESEIDPVGGSALGRERPYVGDQNGDGLDDLLLGAPFYTTDRLFEGRGYLFVGGPSLTGTISAGDAQATWDGPDSLAWLGRSKAWIPNVKPGSTGAIVLGACFYYNSSAAGRVYVIDAGEGLSAVGVEVAAPRAGGARLLACQPNPFDGTTAIRYELPAVMDVSLRVYDVAGRLVRTLESGRREPGSHAVQWGRTGPDNRRVPAGVYFVRLSANRFEMSRKAVVID